MLASLGAILHRAAGVTLGATGHAMPELPPATQLGLRPDEVEVVVIGAHLSGMPLNRDLVALGGRFCRSVETAPIYRLYALQGGPPARPGLVRVGSGDGAPGDGAPIATEVWALPFDGFGRFVAAVPAPLGIGTVRLADGTAPKGFLCEAAGLDRAEDITAHGGWRGYVASRAA